MGNRNIIVSTPKYEWENLGSNLRRVGYDLVEVLDCVAAQIAISDERVSGLVIPSLAMLGIYDRGGEKRIEDLIKNGVDKGLNRIVVVSMLAKSFEKWEALSTNESLVVVRDNINDEFYFNVAQFLACKIDKI